MGIKCLKGHKSLVFLCFSEVLLLLFSVSFELASQLGESHSCSCPRVVCQSRDYKEPATRICRFVTQVDPITNIGKVWDRAIRQTDKQTKHKTQTDKRQKTKHKQTNRQNTNRGTDKRQTDKQTKL